MKSEGNTCFGFKEKVAWRESRGLWVFLAKQMRTDIFHFLHVRTTSSMNSFIDLKTNSGERGKCPYTRVVIWSFWDTSVSFFGEEMRLEAERSAWRTIFVLLHFKYVALIFLAVVCFLDVVFGESFLDQ